MTKDVVMGFRTTEELSEDIKNIADRSGRTTSHVIEYALQFFLWAAENATETLEQWYELKYRL